MTAPTVHLTNWSSLRSPGRAHWFGQYGVWTIMAKPRAWERGYGTFRKLVPDSGELAAVKAGELSAEDYLTMCLDLFRERDLRPKVNPELVGATLCCSCSPHGPCHRRAAAIALVEQGWRVVLDGDALEPAR